MKLEFGLGTNKFPFSNDLELNCIIQKCTVKRLHEYSRAKLTTQLSTFMIFFACYH